MWLHHGVRLVGRGVGRVKPDRRAGKCACEIASFAVGRTVSPFWLGRLALCICQAVGALLGRVFHVHQLCSGTCLLEGLCHHERNRLVIVLDVRSAKQLGGVLAALAQFTNVLGRDDGEHARRALGVAGVHGCDTALGDGRADHVAIDSIRRDLVLLIGIGCRAGGLHCAVDTVGRLADDLELVDRISACGSREFHWFSLSSLLSAPTATCAEPGES